MAFADLAANQMVDENNASTGGFVSIGPKNPGNQCYTKAQALAAYSLSAANMSGYANNQLVPKSAWATGVVSYPFNFINTSSNSVTPPASCGITLNVGVNTMTLYSGSATLAVNSVLYTSAALTGGTEYNGGGWYYKGPNNSTYKIHTSGTIMQIISCANPFGGILRLNIPGYGIVAPTSPGSGVMSIANNASMQIINQSTTEVIIFNNASLAPPYPVVATSGAGRCMQFASTFVVHFNTCVQGGEVIPLNTNAYNVSFGKDSGSGLMVLSLETLNNSGAAQQFYWTFNI
jgi:hypothetical protein